MHVHLYMSTCPYFCFFNVVAWIWCPHSLHLLLRHCLLDFRDRNKLFDFQDLASDLGVDRLEDSSHSLAKTERIQYTLSLFGEADGGSYKSDLEVGHHNNKKRRDYSLVPICIVSFNVTSISTNLETTHCSVTEVRC